jgi:hypothetical protein
VTSQNQGLSFASRRSKKDPGNEVGSAVQFGLKNNVKNTGIPVFTGILMAVYRYSVLAISIHSISPVTF